MKKLLLTALLCHALAALHAQAGRDCFWMFGFADEPDIGNYAFDFCGGGLDVRPLPPGLNFFQANAGISSEAGELLFYTNGFSVMNAAFEQMDNGDMLSVNPQEWEYAVPQGILALPIPGHEQRYMLLYLNATTTLQNTPTGPLFYSIIDMDEDGGLGAIIEKNSVADPLSALEYDKGKITAVRHGNGRDWWVAVPEFGTGRLLVYLLDPDGLHVMPPTESGLLPATGVGSTVFSPDGRYYAHVAKPADAATAFVTLLPFDRCAGTFGPAARAEYDNFYPLAHGLAFSPSSEVLYASLTDRILQYDLSGSDPLAEPYMVMSEAEFDDHSEAAISALLAPDGKIYINSLNGSEGGMHLIASPDVLGPDCGFVLRAFDLPFLNWAMPNYPNFRLGREEGSSCDSLVVQVREQVAVLKAQLQPNPARSQTLLRLEGALPGSGPLRLQLFSSAGQLVRDEALPPGQPEHWLDLAGLPAGMYYLRLGAGGAVLARERVVVVR